MALNFLLSLFRSKPVAPERIASDTIIPLHSQDDTHVNSSICVDFSMRFDDVLDAEKLFNALERLLDRPGWRKLGARLRRNGEGKLEYHIPAEYTKERPCINRTHVTYNMPISAHPLASQLPHASKPLEVGPPLSNFYPILLPEYRSTSIDDWIYTDRAQLSVHIATFTDTTLVTLTWLHTLLDAMGRNTLLRAWTAMLEGRENDIPEFYGYDFDPLASLGEPVKLESEDEEVEEYVHEHRRLTTWQMIQFVFNYFWELFFYPKEEQHSVIIPPSLFDKLRTQAFKDLQTAPKSTLTMDKSSPDKPFLSDGDILCAWWIRLILSCQPWVDSASPFKQVDIINVFGMRNLLADTEPKLLSKDTAYIGNCAAPIHTFLTLQQLLVLPLGHIAARLRAELVRSSTRGQVDAWQRSTKEAVAKTGHPPVYGDGDMIISSFTNWTKGKMFETDFKAAVIKGSGASKNSGMSPHGKPTCIMAEAKTRGFSIRNAGACIGRDSQGNFWVYAVLRPSGWRNVEKAIAGLK